MRMMIFKKKIPTLYRVVRGLIDFSLAFFSFFNRKYTQTGILDRVSLTSLVAGQIISSKLSFFSLTTFNASFLYLEIETGDFN